MQLVRAKNNRNKLEVFDNRLFAIDVELMKSGFRVFFKDLKTGKKHTAAYSSRELFDEEWNLCEDGEDYKDEYYEIINYYQE